MNKSSLKFTLAVLLGVLMAISPSYAQKKKFDLSQGKSLLNKVKSLNQPSPAAPDAAISLPDDNTGGGDANTPHERKLKPPDVKKEISNAENAFSDQSYTEARFYIQQAIQGIELEIGYQILENFPIRVNSVEADKERDVVYSSGAGFAGMEVSREYVGEEGNIKASVVNSSVLSGAQYAMAAMNYGAYDENSKITRYKGYKAALEVDDYSGYKISVPFGQTSVFMVDCSTCQSEDELLATADLFDIEKIKTLLGEQ